MLLLTSPAPAAQLPPRSYSSRVQHHCSGSATSVTVPSTSGSDRRRLSGPTPPLRSSCQHQSWLRSLSGGAGLGQARLFRVQPPRRHAPPLHLAAHVAAAAHLAAPGLRRGLHAQVKLLRRICRQAGRQAGRDWGAGVAVNQLSNSLCTPALQQSQARPARVLARLLAHLGSQSQQTRASGCRFQ